MSAIVTVENVTFDYPRTRALDDVSFSIAPGSVTALVGPNGAGKTTLMRCIAALERPQRGRIAVDGLNVHEHPREAHRLMGYLPDFFGLYDGLSVRRCLYNRAAALGVPSREREERVYEAAAGVGLADRMEQPAGELSRGLRQRLAIGQAIVHGPKLLILDEPASGLDPEARQELAMLMQRLRGEGVTLLVSSHILAELQDYSTDMLIIRDGKAMEHRPIDAAEEDGRLAMTVGLAVMDDRLPALLAAGGGADVVAEGPGARFLGPGDPAGRAALLRSLLQAGLQVEAFGPARRSLQDQYIERVRSRGAVAGPPSAAPPQTGDTPSGDVR